MYRITWTNPETGEKMQGTMLLTEDEGNRYLAVLAENCPGIAHWLEAV
jgi:hypothetical protein